MNYWSGSHLHSSPAGLDVHLLHHNSGFMLSANPAWALDQVVKLTDYRSIEGLLQSRLLHVKTVAKVTVHAFADQLRIVGPKLLAHAVGEAVCSPVKNIFRRYTDFVGIAGE